MWTQADFARTVALLTPTRLTRPLSDREYLDAGRTHPKLVKCYQRGVLTDRETANRIRSRVR